MSKKNCYILPCCMLAAALLQAQPPEAVAVKPDSEAVRALIEKARQTGGPEWSGEVHFFCEAPRANSPADPTIQPARIFDNVYVIGNLGTVAYVIRTSAGLMMIDSLGANQVDTLLLPGFQKLGLDPGLIKTVIISHGHADHFGGSFYLQAHYNAHIYVSAPDWDLMLNPPVSSPAGQNKGPAGAPVTPPRKDMVIAEGRPIVLGDETVMPFSIPGHTPGSMGFIFPVQDLGQTHMAALYGGTVLLAGRIPDEGLQQYLKSIGHFKEEAKRAKVDVELQNHPLMDGFPEKLAKLGTRSQGEANPFVVGQAGYGKFLDVMSRCMDVQIARRKEQ